MTKVPTLNITREQLVEPLNEGLAGEYLVINADSQPKTSRP